MASLTCLDQELLRAPQQLDRRLHAVIEGLSITARHLPA